jgi:hypothetical protein
MSVGEFEVMGYKIRLYSGLFTIHKDERPNMSLRVGALHVGNNNDLDDLQITVRSNLHATVETSKSFMRVAYFNHNGIDSNGQIELAIKIEGEAYPSWVALINEIPREVIFTAVSILNGDDYCEQYRVRRNEEGQVITNNVNDPGFENTNVPGPTHSNNENEPSGNNASAGGRRRKTRKSKKKGR